MQISIVSGSHRHKSNSLKVSGFLKMQWEKLDVGDKAAILSLEGNPLPLWDETVRTEGSPLARLWQPYSAALHASEAIVLVTPEWGGMASPAIKNFLLYCSRRELSHKPVLLVGVSNGAVGGIMPLNELRAHSSKNNQMCFLPEHIVVRYADALLNDADHPASDGDKYIRARIVHALRILKQYGLGLRLVRDSGVVDYKAYPFGM